MDASCQEALHLFQCPFQPPSPENIPWYFFSVGRGSLHHPYQLGCFVRPALYTPTLIMYMVLHIRKYIQHSIYILQTKPLYISIWSMHNLDRVNAWHPHNWYRSNIALGIVNQIWTVKPDVPATNQVQKMLMCHRNTKMSWSYERTEAWSRWDCFRHSICFRHSLLRYVAWANVMRNYLHRKMCRNDWHETFFLHACLHHPVSVCQHTCHLNQDHPNHPMSPRKQSTTSHGWYTAREFNFISECKLCPTNILGRTTLCRSHAFDRLKSTCNFYSICQLLSNWFKT